MLQKVSHCPCPKKQPNISSLNDFRPVALTSVIMKTFERLVLRQVKAETPPCFDSLQFAYRANRSVDDAVSLVVQGDQKKTEPTFTAITPRVLIILASYFRTVCQHPLQILIQNIKFVTYFSRILQRFYKTYRKTSLTESVSPFKKQTDINRHRTVKNDSILYNHFQCY